RERRVRAAHVERGVGRLYEHHAVIDPAGEPTVSVAAAQIAEAAAIGAAAIAISIVAIVAIAGRARVATAARSTTGAGTHLRYPRYRQDDGGQRAARHAPPGHGHAPIVVAGAAQPSEPGALG